MKYLTIKTLILFIFLSSNLFAQNNLQYKTYSVKDGLSQSTINCIIQDKKGYMWFGTQNGLNRFDGYTFDNIRINEKSNNLFENLITCFAEDYKGNLWIGTYSGLFIYSIDDEKFIHNNLKENTCKFFPGNDSLIKEKKISNIYADSAIMYVITDTNILRIDLRTKSKAKNLRNLESDNNGITTFYKSPIIKRNDTLFIGIYKDLYITNTKIDTAKIFKTHSSKFNDFYLKGQKTFFAATEKKGNPHSGNLFEDTTVYSFTEIKDRVWIGTEKGLFTIDTDFNTQSKRKIKLLDDRYFDCYKDVSDNIWIATYSQGVLKYDLKDKKFSKYKDFPKSIRSVFKSNDTLWIGTGESGLFIYKGEKQIFKKYTDTLKSFIGGIKQVNNEIWINASNENFEDNRIYIFKDNNFREIEIAENGSLNLKGNRVYRIYNDDKKYIWIGTADGLFRLKKKGKKYFLKEFNIKNVSSIIQKDENELLIGTFSGLFSYNYNNDSVKQELNLGKKISIECIIKNENNFWISTNFGLSKIDKDLIKIKEYTKKEGFPNNLLYDIIPYKNYIWYSSNTGIGKLSTNNNKFALYGNEDGIQYPEFNFGASFKDSLGYIYFGGIDGLYSFHPDSIKDYNFKAPVYITKLVTADSIYKYPNINTEITLSPDNNSLTFYFSALDYTKPLLNQYKYKLEGHENNWKKTTGNEAKAIYTNIKSGEYIFRVKGTNNDGVWSDKIAILRITKQKAWYETYWAYFGYILLFGIGVYFLYVFITKRIKYKEGLKQNKILIEKEKALNEELEEEKTKVQKAQEELVFQKTTSARAEFIASITHEINTPIGIAVTNLTTLQNEINKIETLYKKEKLDSYLFEKYMEDTKVNTDLSYRNIERASRLVNSLREISRDQITFTEREIEIVKYLRDLIDTLTPEWKNNNLKINVICEKDNMKVRTVPGYISQIFTNLIVNSVRHGFDDFNEVKKARINIDIKRHGSILLMTYTDNGIGIKKEYIDRIFDMYFSTKEGKGSGLGMYIVKNLVEELNGSIRYNRPENGASFDLKIKIK